MGLLLAGKDVALRVDQKAKVAELQAQLGLSLGNPEERFRQAVKGQRWWRLGPLTEAESWQAMEMVRATGLEPLRGELRRARMGKWRHAVYFAAVGSPSRTSLTMAPGHHQRRFWWKQLPRPRWRPRQRWQAPGQEMGQP